MSKRRFPGGFPREPELPAIRQANALTSLISCRVLVLRQVEFAQETARDSQKSDGWVTALPRVGPVLQYRSGRSGSRPKERRERVSDLGCLSTRFPASIVVQYLRDRPAPFGDSVRSRLPQHEIPGKDGATVPPGSDRSLRGQCPIPAASARDSQQGWCYSTSGIGPLPAHLACLSTRFPARVVVQYLRDRTAPFVRFYGKGHPTHPGTAVSAGIGTFPARYLRDRPAPFDSRTVSRANPTCRRSDERDGSGRSDGPISPASARETARDSQRYLRDRTAPCLSTRFPARMALQYLRDRPAPFGDSVRLYGKGHLTHPGTAGIAPPLPRVGPVLQYLRDRTAPCLSIGIFFDFP